MAMSTCVKCEGNAFELKEVVPNGSNFKFYFVQCSSCGGVVGVVHKSHVPTMLRRIGEKLGVDL
jgi:hypothetical protein